MNGPSERDMMPARAAFLAFRERHFGEGSAVRWDDLDPVEKLRWYAAAKAAIQQFEDQVEDLMRDHDRRRSMRR